MFMLLITCNELGLISSTWEIALTKCLRCLAAQNHIRWSQVNSCDADAQLEVEERQKALQGDEWNHTLVCILPGKNEWHKGKQSIRHYTLAIFIVFASTYVWSKHNSCVSKMCIQNIANIFAGFWIRACWICAKYAEN